MISKRNRQGASTQKKSHRVKQKPTDEGCKGEREAVEGGAMSHEGDLEKDGLLKGN